MGPGGVEYDVSFRSFDTYNFGTATFVRDIRFDVAPAPIPLPAAGRMLLAGFGGMGWVWRGAGARHRGARATTVACAPFA